MRLALLTLILGIVVGFAAHSFIVAHPQWCLACSCAKQPAPQASSPATVIPAKPRTYPAPEKTLTWLRKQFDEAVVVVLADETFDDFRKLVHVSVLEVWKGPAGLVGKPMDYRLDPPMSYLHPNEKQRVLIFMPMTPYLYTSGTFSFDGDVLRSNPACTIKSLKEALVKPQG